MRDFNGHELQVGDIVIISGDEHFYYARVDELDEMPYNDNGANDIVWVHLMEGLENPRARRFYYKPTRVIWYTSEYAHLPKTYVGAVFNREGNVNA